MPILNYFSSELFQLLQLANSGNIPMCRTCLQHSNFIHHDIEGDSLEECQVSAARIAAKRAYGGEAGLGAGEEVQTQQR